MAHPWMAKELDSNK